MGGSNHFARLLPFLVGIAASGACVAARTDTADTWRARVATKLLSVYDSRAGRQPPLSVSPPIASGMDTSIGAPHFDSSGRVQVDVHYDCSGSAPTEALSSAGLLVSAAARIATLCVVEGWVPPATLRRIAAVSGVTRVRMPAYAARLRPRTLTPDKTVSIASQKSAGGYAQTEAATANTINRNGVSIMRADQFVTQTGSSGAGVTVGVQSIGVSNLNVVQGRGELPTVQVLDPSGGSSSKLGDEGTVLLEEVHAVAPGASLSFCGPGTFIEYTSCLGQLIGAGATILVDDIVFLDQDPMSSDNMFAQAIEQLLAQNPNVAIFTVVGNDNGSYWEGSYTPVSVASQSLPALSCPANGTTQVDNYITEFSGSPSQVLTVKQPGTYPVTFAWADPVGQNMSHFDVYWSSNSAGTTTGCFSTSSSTDTLVSSSISLNAGTYTVYVATPDASQAGKFLKLWIGGDGLTTLSKPTPGSVVSPQAFARGVITIGAVNGSDGIGNGIESFSSLGPITVSYPAPATIQAPLLVAPDGIYVDAAGTYFTSYLFPDGNFYGTSAAVPNAGAVAALLRGAFPSLTVAQLQSALQAGAAQLGASAPDGTFGYGRVDAIGALGTLPAPTMTALPNSAIDGSVSSPNYPFTVTGTGNLHFTVTSSNAALLPASIVAAGSAGVTIAPPTCGVSTLTCTLSVAPMIGQGGTANVTVSVVDGANRSAPATMMVTVTNPTPAPPVSPAPPPTVTVASGSGGGGGGGALNWWEVACLALLAGLHVLTAGQPGTSAAPRQLGQSKEIASRSSSRVK